MKRGKRRALGQHFLSNPRALQKIIKKIDPQQDELIIEIGAGKGALTSPLAQRAGRIIAIEKDPSLIPFLQKKRLPNVLILEKNILKIDFGDITKEKKIKLVGNLPYSISSSILFKVFAEKELISECFFLLQKEVAERLCSIPGSKKYAPISILFQNYFSAELHFTLSPASFSPPPRVESALISLKRRSEPIYSIENDKIFLQFLKAAFQHRRKKLINNLLRMDLSSSQAKQSLPACRIEEGARPEQVSLSQYVKLFNTFYKK